MRSMLSLAALAAVLLPAAALADAGTLPTSVHGSSLAMPMVELASVVVVGPGQTAPAHPRGAGDLAVRYRPRGESRNYYRPTATGQVHAGFYSPTHNFDTGFDGGFRVGSRLSPMVELGFSMDWYYSSSSGTIVEGPGSIPGSRIELSGTNSNLVPLLFYAQVSGDENMSVIPYAGGGVGYEWLWVSGNALDPYSMYYSYDESFGGFGWQVWGGAQFPLNGQTRLTGEVYYNGSRVGRDIGQDWSAGRETIDVSGVGMRFGVNWGF